ncbi:MAG: ATP-binding cassette domain-containing protein [Actinomycetia bacterium]|nr:ATP-binding cassette domain-containing protein [Actinomycetes bacterium]
MARGDYLEIVDPDGVRWRLDVLASLQFGRENSDVVLPDPAVSRNHLLIQVDSDGWYASDLGSSNGTTINGNRIGRRVVLSTGDEIRVGDTRLLVQGAPDQARQPAGRPGAPTTADLPPVVTAQNGLSRSLDHDPGLEEPTPAPALPDLDTPPAPSDPAAPNPPRKARVSPPAMPWVPPAPPQPPAPPKRPAQDEAPLGPPIPDDLFSGPSTLPLAVVRSPLIDADPVGADPADEQLATGLIGQTPPPADPAAQEHGPSPEPHAISDGLPIDDGIPVVEGPPSIDDLFGESGVPAPGKLDAAAAATWAPSGQPRGEEPVAAPRNPPIAGAVASPSPIPPNFEVVSKGGVEVRYQPGSAGERAAKSLLRAAVNARSEFRGFGSESWGVTVTINLVDPFPDPLARQLVVSGSFIDAGRYEIWQVVTPETPPEDPHRVLALLFGAALPCSADAEVLIEGYGLHLCDAIDLDANLKDRLLPSLDEAEGELRNAMTVSFVRFLLERESEAVFCQLLASPPGRLEEGFATHYGATRTALEAAWQRDIQEGKPDVRPGEFLRLSLEYLKPYKLGQVELFLYMLLSLAFVSAFPFVARELFDSVIPSGELSQVINLLIILAITLVVSVGAGLRQAHQSAYVSGAVVRDIRQVMFERLQHIPTSSLGRYPQGDVLSRLFSDVGRVQSALSDTITRGIFQAVSLVVSAIIMLALNLPLGVIVLVAAPVAVAVSRFMAKGATEHRLAVQQDNAALFGVAAENYQANPVVKMFDLAGYERTRFGRSSERLFNSQVRLSLFDGLLGLSANMIVTVLRLVVLGLGTWLIFEDRFTLGGLVAFVWIMGAVVSPVTELTALGQDIQASTGALTRINEVLDADLEARGENLGELAPLHQELRLVTLGFSYTHERWALDGLDLVIKAGSKVAFVGPSGSGKSTALKMLMRMYEPDEGAVLVDGVDVRQRSLASLRRQVGVVFQDPFLFDTTLRENIALGKPNATDAEIVAAAEAAEIDGFLDSLPRGYDCPVSEGAGSLTSGQRQQVSIARALVRDPRILLLDEATSALDPKTERQINDILDRVGGERTVVSVTHRLASIVDYDRIFVLVDGHLDDQGTHDELVARDGVYARLWAEQTGGLAPNEAPFDAEDALKRISLFRSLSDDELNGVAARLRSVPLAAGENVTDAGGRLAVISRGRAELLTPGVDGALVPINELSQGDVFGLTSLIADRSGGSLHALEALQLLVLDEEALAAIASEHPAVAAGLLGETDGPAPTRGRLVTRSTMVGRATTRRWSDRS